MYIEEWLLLVLGLMQDISPEKNRSFLDTELSHVLTPPNRLPIAALKRYLDAEAKALTTHAKELQSLRRQKVSQHFSVAVLCDEAM